MANFGYYNYGTTIKGRLHYPIKNKDGCEPFVDEHFVEEHLVDRRKHGYRPILMVDRGKCHFVIKAMNVQNFGGMMMVVVDNVESEDPELLIMADDGRGSAVKIPSFLIGHNDGERLKEAIHEELEAEEANADGNKRTWSQKVIVQAEIDLARVTSGVVNVDMWYGNIYELFNSGWDLGRFTEIQQIFEQDVQIHPRLITNQCLSCSREEKKALCVENGKYCPVIPTEFQMNEVTPQSIIDQNLREICIFEALPADRKSLWFSYIKEVVENCMVPNALHATFRPVTADCHEQHVVSLLKTAQYAMDMKIDWDQYQSCINDQESALSQTRSDGVLDRDMKLVKYVGAVFHPSISVQNHTYKGDYKNANNVFKAICSTMAKRPPVCSTVSIVDPFKPYMFEDLADSPQKSKEYHEAMGKQIERVRDYDANL